MNFNKLNAPPKGKPWAWLSRELITSEAWRSMSINARRLLDFLMNEHMGHGGRRNGALQAPRRQLVEVVGIGNHFISGAIDKLIRLGLIDCIRGRRRIASVYSLTWLPLHDGTPATDRWQYYRKVSGSMRGAKKSETLSAKEHSMSSAKQHSKRGLLDAKQHSKTPKFLGAKQHSLLRDSYQGGDVSSDLSVRGGGTTGVVGAPLVSKLPWSKPTFVEIECPQARAKRWVQ